MTPEPLERAIDDVDARRRARQAGLDRRERIAVALVVIGFVGLAAIAAAASVIAWRSLDTAEDAVANQQEARAASTRRIDKLNDEITSLNGLIVQLLDEAEVNGQRIGELTAQVATLKEQVRQLGGEPVVIVPSSTTPTTSSPAPPNQPTSPPTTAPRPPPNQPDDDVEVCLPLVGCIDVG